MRYVVKTTDGVIVTTLIPCAAVANGKRYRLSGVGSDIDGKFLRGEAYFPFDGDVADLEPDSFPGVTLEFPTMESILAKWDAGNRAKVISYRPARPGEVARLSRAWRDAWRDDGTALVVDMPHAREIHRDRMRMAREPLLSQLDVDYTRADERGDQSEKRRVADRRQALRDVTADPGIEGATTPEQLAAVWPDILAPAEVANAREFLRKADAPAVELFDPIWPDAPQD